MIRKASQLFAKPIPIQHPAPTARDIIKIGFLNPFVSAIEPQIGPRMATTSVAKLAA